jgi:putative transcriptional regulator
MTPLKPGTLLIASFDLEDHERHLVEQGHITATLFTRTVILLVHYESGSQPLGLVLNSPMGDRLKRYSNEAIERYITGLDQESRPAEDLFYWGGPCEADKLTFMHRIEACAQTSRTVYPGLYFGGDLDAVREHIAIGAGEPADLRYFLGYAGWDPGQLENEISQHQWLLSDGSQSLALDEPSDTLWQHALYALGGKYRSMSFVPLDTAVN